MMAKRGDALDMKLPILRSPYREKAEQLLAKFYSDIRPPGDYYAFRRRMLLKRDNAEKLSGALWGLDLRDPTGDRRLIELCLSFPADQLVSPAAARPAYETAFSDRIPPAVLHSKKRGLQGADWFELYDRNDLAHLFQSYQRNEILDNFFDFRRIAFLLDRWPKDPHADRAKYPSFANELLGALGVGAFIELHFPN
jgi:asparagine synthase (glutamine-hydrolysing)